MLINFVAVFALIGMVAGGAIRSPQSRLNQQLIRDCEKYGGENAWDKVKMAGEKFSECILSEIDAYTMLQINNITDNLGGLLDVTKKLCGKKNPLLSCAYDLMDEVTPCVDPALRGKTNDSKKAVHEFVDYICYNDAEIVGKLVSKSATDCIENNSSKIYHCVLAIEAAELDSTPIRTRCEMFEDGRSCIMNTLNACDDKSYAEFSEYFLDTVVVGSYCEKGAITDVKVNNI